MSLKNIPWLEIFAPFWKDIQIVANETSAMRLIKNNDELLNDDRMYEEVVKKAGFQPEAKK